MLETVQERYLRDDVRVRLGGLAANLARVAEQAAAWAQRVLEMSGLTG